MNNRFKDTGAVSITEAALGFLIVLPIVPAIGKLVRSAFGIEAHTMEDLGTKAMVATATMVLLMAVSTLMVRPLRQDRARAAEDALPTRTMLLMMAFLSVQSTVLGTWVTAEGPFDATRAAAAGGLFALTAAAAVLAFHRLARKALATA